MDWVVLGGAVLTIVALNRCSCRTKTGHHRAFDESLQFGLGNREEATSVPVFARPAPRPGRPFRGGESGGKGKLNPGGDGGLWWPLFLVDGQRTYRTKRAGKSGRDGGGDWRGNYHTTSRRA